MATAALFCLGFRKLLPPDCVPASDASNLWPACSNLCDTAVQPSDGGVCECFAWEDVLPANATAVAAACGSSSAAAPAKWTPVASMECGARYVAYTNGTTLAQCTSHCLTTEGCVGFSAPTALGAPWVATRGLACSADYAVYATLDVAACQALCAEGSASCSGFSWPAPGAATGCSVHDGASADCAPRAANSSVYWRLDRAALLAARGGCRVHGGGGGDCAPRLAPNRTYYARGAKQRVIVRRALACGHPVTNCSAVCDGRVAFPATFPSLPPTTSPTPSNWRPCVGWRATNLCDADGWDRNPADDLACDATVPKAASGYCLCSDGDERAHMGCGHETFRCDAVCHGDVTPAASGTPGWTSGCVAWRATAGCDPEHGARNPSSDKLCEQTIGTSESGYCYCANGERAPPDYAALGCAHESFTCSAACKGARPGTLPPSAAAASSAPTIAPLGSAAPTRAPTPLSSAAPTRAPSAAPIHLTAAPAIAPAPRTAAPATTATPTAAADDRSEAARGADSTAVAREVTLLVLGSLAALIAALIVGAALVAALLLLRRRRAAARAASKRGGIQMDGMGAYAGL